MIGAMAITLTMRQAAMVEGRRLQAGAALMGEDEFRAFYERTARPLWGYLSRLTGSPQLADDLLQEAYFRFHRAGARHESEAHRRNSLFQIATNLARDAARKGRRQPEVALPEEVASGAVLASAAATPEREVGVKTDLARALAHLEPLQRELLWLAYAEGESHEQIAQALGLRTLSVKTLLLRARRKLAGILAAPGGGK
jgi:RNA polymerase sigma-70 factor (ECF subfamily)